MNRNPEVVHYQKPYVDFFLKSSLKIPF
jgi:hypothetical protein